MTQTFMAVAWPMKTLSSSSVLMLNVCLFTNCPSANNHLHWLSVNHYFIHAESAAREHSETTMLASPLEYPST